MIFLIPSVIVFYCRGHPLDQPLLFGCPQLALYLARFSSWPSGDRTFSRVSGDREA